MVANQRGYRSVFWVGFWRALAVEEDGKLPLEGRKAWHEAGGRARGRCRAP